MTAWLDQELTGGRSDAKPLDIAVPESRGHYAPRRF